MNSNESGQICVEEVWVVVTLKSGRTAFGRAPLEPVNQLIDSMLDDPSPYMTMRLTINEDNYTDYFFNVREIETIRVSPYKSQEEC